MTKSTYLLGLVRYQKFCRPRPAKVLSAKDLVIEASV